MYCPRLDHFVRLNANGSITRCGHMVKPQEFDTITELDTSDWLREVKTQMRDDQWPEECVLCQQTETLKRDSIRIKSIARHKVLHPLKKNYLIVGGVLDNTCNSACQTCSANLSTKIGSLESKKYKVSDNYVRFWELPQSQILEIDVNGGEPTASKNYKNILKHLPPNTKIVRMNTNGSRMITELEDVLKKGITAIVTLSLDGVDKIHDYVRWPITWKKYNSTVDAYLQLRDMYKNLKLDFWTTVSCLNVNNLPDIKLYAQQKNIPHAWAFLNSPDVYNVKYKNKFTANSKHIAPDIIGSKKDNTEELNSYIRKQDYLRKIDIKDYFNF